MIEPDTKDWTWVLERPCPDCGFDPASVDLAAVPRLIRGNAASWPLVLASERAAQRPAEHVWSPLEYACHVRDVHLLFDERVHLMLDHEVPTFANWDQDATAVESDYGAQVPSVVGDELVAAAERIASTYAAVEDADAQRRGLRSNGDVFTIDTIARYHLHDVVHHAHDVAHVLR